MQSEVFYCIPIERPSNTACIPTAIYNIYGAHVFTSWNIIELEGSSTIDFLTICTNDIFFATATLVLTDSRNCYSGSSSYYRVCKDLSSTYPPTNNLLFSSFYTSWWSWWLWESVAIFSIKSIRAKLKIVIRYAKG